MSEAKVRAAVAMLRITLRSDCNGDEVDEIVQKAIQMLEEDLS